MIPLTDKIWKNLEGGYKQIYDASVPLLKLENSTTLSGQDEVLDELFEELHHQGDVGIASYFSVYHLIRIGIENGLSNWKVLGLIATIEIERHSTTNPKLPIEYEIEYFKMLNRTLELTNINKNWNRTFASCALSAIAASKGYIDMAKVILEFENEELTDKFNEFLEGY